MNELFSAEKPSLKMLDCFCGMGGVSDGFAMEGFDVTGIDIVDAPKMLGYKHRFIQADMLTLKGEDYRGYDVIWGSPPCRDFSTIANLSFKWKNARNIPKGLGLVNEFLKFVDMAKPKIWIMENVPQLKRYLWKEPNQISFIATPSKKRAFWGNYPLFLMPLEKGTPHNLTGKPFSPMRTWLRSRIPLACSRAFAKACKEKLLEDKNR